MISKWIHDDDRNLAWNANAGIHPIRIGLSWFEASKVWNDAKLSVVQSHPILEKNWKRKFSSNSCIPHGKSYFRRQETNFSSESPNQPSLDFFGMKQPFWERNKEKKMNHSEVKIIGRHAWWTWICLSVPNTWKHLFCVWFLSLRLSDVHQDH